MCPFLDDEDYDDENYQIDNNVDNISNNIKAAFSDDEKKFFIIGGLAAIITFCIIAYIMYSNSKPIDLDDLPVIKADNSPIKIKPPINSQINHQDKIVYDNISGETRKSVKEKIIPQPEEILCISEEESNDVLSEEEKRKIIQAFDDLAPPKEYKINYVKTHKLEQSNTDKNTKYDIPKSSAIKIVEEASPIKKIVSEYQTKKSKNKLRDLIPNKNTKLHSNNIKINSLQKYTLMVQIASLPTKSAAEAEYNRLCNKNKILKSIGKRITKVDLGKLKGSTYRIQVGPFKNKKEAQKIISILKSNGCIAYIVK